MCISGPYDSVIAIAEFLIGVLLIILLNRTVLRRESFKKHTWMVIAINIVCALIVLSLLAVLTVKAC